MTYETNKSGVYVFTIPSRSEKAPLAITTVEIDD